MPNLKEIENNEILQLLGLEKSLVYFATSLKSNSLLLQKMKSTKLIKFDDSLKSLLFPHCIINYYL